MAAFFLYSVCVCVSIQSLNENCLWHEFEFDLSETINVLLMSVMSLRILQLESGKEKEIYEPESAQSFLSSNSGFEKEAMFLVNI